MKDKSCTEITGLQGNNPFEFIAAIGMQVAFDYEKFQPRLWWTEDVISRPCINCEFSIEEVAAQAMRRLSIWRQSPGFSPRHAATGKEIEGGSTLKMTQEDLRQFLVQAREDKYAGKFYMSLLTEGSVDGKEKSKPTDLNFLSGNQKFLQIVNEIIANVTKDEIVDALTTGRREENNEVPTLMLDIYDDSVYALRSTDPSGKPKRVSTGTEALAILGLSRFPVFGTRGRTLTQGCTGSWKHSKFEWPIWVRPARADAVRSILATATPYADSRTQIYESLSIAKIYRSFVVRKDGRYGTFKPPEVIWQSFGSSHDRDLERGRRIVEILDKLASEAKENGLTAEVLATIMNTKSGD